MLKMWAQFSIIYMVKAEAVFSFLFFSVFYLNSLTGQVGCIFSFCIPSETEGKSCADDLFRLLKTAKMTQGSPNIFHRTTTAIGIMAYDTQHQYDT